MTTHIDPASAAWGLSLGLMLGAWIHDTLKAPGRRMVRPRGSYSLPPDHDWRRSFNHENTNRPAGEPPLKLRRSTVKPQFPPPRIIREDFLE